MWRADTVVLGPCGYCGLDHALNSMACSVRRTRVCKPCWPHLLELWKRAQKASTAPPPCQGMPHKNGACNQCVRAGRHESDSKYQLENVVSQPPRQLWDTVGYSLKDHSKCELSHPLISSSWLQPRTLRTSLMQSESASHTNDCN